MVLRVVLVDTAVLVVEYLQYQLVEYNYLVLLLLVHGHLDHYDGHVHHHYVHPCMFQHEGHNLVVLGVLEGCSWLEDIRLVVVGMLAWYWSFQSWSWLHSIASFDLPFHSS